MIGKNEKMGGFGGKGLDSENCFLKQSSGRDELEEMFGFCFSAQWPEALPTATGHDEEEERGRHRESLCES